MVETDIPNTASLSSWPQCGIYDCLEALSVLNDQHTEGIQRERAHSRLRSDMRK